MKNTGTIRSASRRRTELPGGKLLTESGRSPGRRSAAAAAPASARSDDGLSSCALPGWHPESTPGPVRVSPGLAQSPYGTVTRDPVTVTAVTVTGCPGHRTAAAAERHCPGSQPHGAAPRARSTAPRSDGHNFAGGNHWPESCTRLVSSHALSPRAKP
eukprot:675204-Hanusia_phi.AAC.17